MESIGQIIKARRTERGLSLAEAHEATKITTQNLAAIEEDRYDAFPNRVYARAFLRDYANFLGLDSADLLQRYEQEWGPAVPTPLRRHRSRAIGYVLAAIVVIGAVAAVTVFYTKYMPMPERPVRPTEASAPRPRPAPQPATGTTPTAPVTGTASTTRTTPTSPQPPKPTAQPRPEKVVLVMRARNSAVWVRIKVDGDKPVERTLRPGEQATIVADQQIGLRVGNAGGLDVTANGKHIGPLGASGQVVNRVFTRTPAPNPG